jgi:hypothetical protein
VRRHRILLLPAYNIYIGDKPMKKYIILAIAVLSIGAWGADNLLLAQEIKPRREVVAKEVFGAVSGISSNFVAVVYGRDPKSEILTEMAFNVGKEVVIKNKKSLKEINPEDSIKVLYDEITETREDGRIIKSRVAKEIVFLRPADKKPEAQQVAEPQAPAGE